MKSTVTLLLNLSVLLVNFFVSWGTTDTQARVLRTTARVSYAAPMPAAARRPAPPAPPQERAKLVCFLARCEGLEKMDSTLVQVLLEARDRYAGELERFGNRLRGLGGNGFATRGQCGELLLELRAQVARTLRDAAVTDPALREKLVRIVLASTG